MDSIQDKQVVNVEGQDIEVSLPKGVQFVEMRPGKTVWLAIGKIPVGDKDVELTFLKSMNAPPDADFLPAKVAVDGKIRWEFQMEKESGFNGMAFCCFVKEELVIYLVERRAVVKAYPLTGLVRATVVTTAMGATKVELPFTAAEMLDLKIAVSKAVKLPMEKSPVENAIVAARAKRETAERERLAEATRLEQVEAARLLAEAEAKARREREARRAEIRGRSEITFYHDAQKIRAIPVVGDEWKALHNGTRAVIVESFDKATGACGSLLRFFFVAKTKGEPKQSGVLEDLSWEKKRPPEEKGVEVEKYLTLQVGDDEADIRVVMHFPTKEALRAAREAGLNGGAQVALGEPDANGRYQIVTVSTDKVKTVGLGLPVEV